MASEKALALVVRGVDWSESSRIATLFTREYGKVRALAKGGRRLKSSFEIAFDLLTVCDVVLIRKHTAGLDLLTEARLKEKFPAIRENLDALYAGYYIAELLADGTADYDPHPALFDAACDTLRRLENEGDSRSFHLLAFELVWLRELGYSPRLEECAVCGTPLPGTVTRVQFSPLAGGIVCSGCDANAADRRWISRAALDALQALTAGQTPATTALAEVRSLVSHTVCHLLGKRPRLMGYIEKSP